jgi:Flp pilus assembly protein CpaB
MSWQSRASALAALLAFSINLAGTNFGGICLADDPKVKILVPVVEIAPYHYFQDSKKFTEVEWPKSKLREDINETITSFDQIKGKTSRHYKLKPNEPIYKDDITEAMEQDSIDYYQQSGVVAHSIHLSTDRSLTKNIKVGDRVDIAATKQPNVPGEPAITIQILEDIEVLSFGLKLDKNPTTEDQNRNNLVLRVTRPQSIVLGYYQFQGKLDVVKRKPGDPQRVKDVFTLSPEKNTSIIAPSTPEQKVLDNWLGSWRSTYEQPKVAGAEEKTGTAELTISRVVGGQFILENSEHSDNTTGSVTSTYDTQKKNYRGWWFSSNGQTGESTGKWDADSKTMIWTSVGEPSPVTTVKQHFVDNDNIEWEVVTRDRAGKELFRMEGKSVRIKAPTTK